MNQLRYLFFLFAFLTSLAKLSGQNVSDLPANSFPFNLSGQTLMAFDNRYEGIKGSYTFFENFSPGIVVMKKGTFNNVPINYDAYTDNLIARSEKINDVVQLRKDMILSFVLRSVSGEEFLFVKKPINENPIFLLEIIRDSISLYCKIGKTIKKADYGGAYNTSETRHDEFVTVNTYFILKGDSDPQEIQNSKKDILKAFPEFEDELSDYLKRNKINFNDYNQMKLMFTYINKLKN